MKKILFTLAIVGTIILSSCANTNPIEPELSSIESSLTSSGVMGDAMNKDKELLSTIKNTKSASVITLTDGALKRAIGAETNTSTFFNSDVGKSFLRQYVLTTPITADGTYVSLSGSKWQIIGGIALQKINGISITSCVQAQANIEGANNYLIMHCKASEPIF